MPTFVALLRGINVGRGNRVPMAELRSLLVDLGCTDVQTLLNSGNAIFRATQGTAPSHSRALHEALKSRLGVDTPVIVKSAEAMIRAGRENPLAPDCTDPSRLLLAFTGDAPSLKALSIASDLITEPEAFHLGSECAYLWCAHGILESRAAQAWVGKAGKAVTTRNWATVQKIITLLRAFKS